MDTRIKSLVKNLKRKEVKKMKNLLALLMAATLVVSTSGVSLAVVDGSATYTATVTPASVTTPSVVTSFSASLKKISDNSSATNVTWNGVEAKGTDWKSAEQYVQVQGFATFNTWGIQIYTDNKGAGATPAYSGAGDPAGLVRATDDPGTTENEIGKSALPMSWRVVVDKKFAAASTDLSITQKYIAAIDFYVLLRILADYTNDTSYFAPWSWVLDKNTPDCDPVTPGAQPFGTYQVYATAVGDRGVTVAANDYKAIPSITSTYYVYFGAKFLNAAASATYTTTKLTVEMYHL